MLSARKFPGSSIGQAVLAGIGTVAVGVLQRAGSGSGTANDAGTAGVDRAGAGSSTTAAADGPETVFVAATIFGIGLDALTRPLSERLPSARSNALCGLP